MADLKDVSEQKNLENLTPKEWLERILIQYDRGVITTEEAVNKIIDTYTHDAGKNHVLTPKEIGDAAVIICEGRDKAFRQIQVAMYDYQRACDKALDILRVLQ